MNWPIIGAAFGWMVSSMLAFYLAGNIDGIDGILAFVIGFTFAAVGTFLGYFLGIWIKVWVRDRR